jgi:hypothetical protein
MSKETISRERLEAPPGTIYAETILEPSHLARALLLAARLDE